MKLRSFISIELSDELKSRFEQIQGDLKECRADIRWVKTENVHLTLKFLGSIYETDTNGIQEVISSACRNCQSFDLEVAGIGVFPAMRSPRVLWAGINESNVLSLLHGEIDQGLATLGFKREKRRFSPHLTLGRFKSSRNKELLIEKISSFEGGVIGTVGVDAIKLMRSELHSDGAKYSVISEVALGIHERT